METGSVDSPSREIRIVPAEKNGAARLLWAINHYISTTEEVRKRENGSWTIIKPYPMPIKLASAFSPTQAGWLFTMYLYPIADGEQSKKDMDALIARIDMNFNWSTMIPEGVGMIEIVIRDSDTPILADALASKPGPLGWGSGKAETIDRYEWRREE